MAGALGVFLVSALVEEVGWTAYALAPLQRRLGWLGASVLLGVAWGLFHVAADLQGGRDLDWIVGQRLAGVAFRVIIVWLYVRTGQVLWVPVVVHALGNVSWLAFPLNGSHYDPALIAPVATATCIVLIGCTRRNPRPG